MNTTAIWTIELNCTCPHCEKYVDLLDYPDFWDGRDIQAAENGTDKTRNAEVICPECEKEFISDFYY